MPTLRESIEAKYEILERIGQGGMGAVYKARHRLLDQERAIKVIRTPVELSAEAGERFLREARVASRLRHPNLAILHDYAVADDGNAWLVLEWIDGFTLREALRRHGPPPLSLSLEIARQTCEALAYLHRQRIVHRDVSPGNLMLAREEGRPLVKLIDLGLAKALEGTGDGLTTGGLFVGKLRYAAPEQFGTDGVDARSDLYSLGVVLYEMLTGWCPVEGHDPKSWMAGHLFREPLRFEESDPEERIPEDLRELVLRTLTKNPEERPGSAEELAESLRVIQVRHPLQGDEMEMEGVPAVAAVAAAPEAIEEEDSSVSLALRRPESEGEPFDALPLFAAPAVEAAAVDLGAAPLLASPRFQPPPPRGEEPESYLAPRQEDRRMLWDEEEVEDVDMVEPELLGPAQLPERSWGSLAAAALLLVSLLGVFLWYQRPSASSASAPPPPYAPPVVEEAPAEDVQLMNPLDEPDALPAEEPQVIEELPAEPEPAPEPVEVVQVVEVEPEPTPARPRVTRQPERPRPEEPARIAKARTEPPAPKRVVPSGPPASRMAGALRPGPGVEMPIPLDFPSARYPAAARGQGLKVDVHLDILVGEQGQVLEAVVREGDSAGLGFNEAAMDAALATRFQPATRWDLPGKAWTELIIQFEESEASR
ncbi:MAG TPA: TonB family protein [Thermoanaerobaculia bacterium]|nr:TonB family protein [Thermoanaerobaculia bacterium]